MNEVVKISIPKDFSEFPWGRVPADGPDCGANFREKLLIPNLKLGKEVIVSLDGADSYGTSFLEEAFGGLVRSGFDEDTLNKRLKIHAEAPEYKFYADRAREYIHEAQQ